MLILVFTTQRGHLLIKGGGRGVGLDQGCEGIQFLAN